MAIEGTHDLRPMSSHEFAQFLLELDDAPLVYVDDVSPTPVCGVAADKLAGPQGPRWVIL